ncbi:hypothetical protein BO79DRAFT_260993 [Aspergillus costaricaensis CBS 115574]|uniref:Uncharacterized protein n=1 Tax=Aspergillus costaricaensis CBS 115574 TaxID=1448317 RepID=A0ACD1IWG3_9EURO|nr:hypothetical protein BO79DRAFT_260993 [Aspergillus costaricaensis CBS 115574]RAK94074.1 hypothetical protein BO79DRAFT_260993 [Aspergillus costaricaensis CBS 115574]
MSPGCESADRLDGRTRSTHHPQPCPIHHFVTTLSSPSPCLSGTHFGHITIDGDRAGYGLSDVSPREPTAQNRVYEVTRLPESYGGILIREFLRMHIKSKVAGMMEGFVAKIMEEVNAGLLLGFQALGDGRLSVVFGIRSVDFRKDLEFGFANGCGTEEARRNLAACRFVYAQRKAMAHNVHYMAPERISDEVLWVLGLTGRQFDG